ncbi:MAG TPA: SDR family NAD(P)-dependent oxidoreductase [Terriglobales bacterium]|nr:SDR family NAD(P)-dependent oxidoreductase [Terriglobales bacterium]
MKDKVVIVTGANGGLGRYVTQAFLDADAAVFGSSLKIQESDFAAANFTAVPADVSTRAGAKTLVEQVVARIGKLDVLVHTVGGFAGGETIVGTDDATFQRMMELNFYSTLYVFQAAIPALRKTGDGRLIAIGSRAATEPGARVSAYSASKAAMVSLVRTAALENKDAGLRVNAILPGTMDTPANRKAMPGADISKWVQPVAVASLIVWLAGEAGKDVNGAAIPVYGSDI